MLKIAIQNAANDAEAAACATAVAALPEAAALQICRTEPDSAPFARLDARYRPAPGWGAAALAATGLSARLVAGCVVSPPGAGWLEWAQWFSEYAHAAPPLPEGPVHREEEPLLPAGNAVLNPAPRSGAWRSSGMFVFYHPPRLSAYLRENYSFSRDLMDSARGLRRFVLLLSRPFLPALILLRLFRHALRLRVLPRFFAVLPILTLFGLIKTAGQIAGLLGAGKRSGLAA